MNWLLGLIKNVGDRISVSQTEPDNRAFSGLAGVATQMMGWP